MTPKPVRIRFLAGQEPARRTIGHFYLRALPRAPEWRLSVWDPLLLVHNSTDGVGYETAMPLLVATLESFAEDSWKIQLDQRKRFAHHWVHQGRPGRIVNPGFRQQTPAQLWGRLLGEQRAHQVEYERMCRQALDGAQDWPGDRLVRFPWLDQPAPVAPWAGIV